MANEANSGEKAPAATLGDELNGVPANKGKRVAKTALFSVRRHRVDNVNKNGLVQYLDKLSLDGFTVLGLNISRDIGGTYEVVSYKDEISA